VDKPVEKIIITPAKSMALPTIPPSLIMESGYAQYYTPFITLKSTLFFIFYLCTHWYSSSFKDLWKSILSHFKSMERYKEKGG